MEGHPGGDGEGNGGLSDQVFASSSPAPSESGLLSPL